MQKNNTPVNTAQWLVLSSLFVLGYWPTYFVPSIEPDLMQKSYFFIMLGYLLVITFATKTRLSVPSMAYTYLLPLLGMLLTFFFSITVFSSFHLSVLIKPFLLFFYVILFYSLLTEHFNSLSSIKIKRALTIVFILQIGVITLQIIFGDVAPLKILSFKKVYDGFGFRAPGTLDWVYITCYFLSFFLAVHIIEFFFGKNKKIAFIFIILSFLAIFLSQSKTGYLATVIVAIYFTFLSIILRLGIAKKIFFSMLVALLLLVALIVYLDINLDYITKFIDLIQQGKLDGSTSTRKKQTLVALNEGLKYWYSGSPLALKGFIIENSYLDYLFRYGIFGFIAFLSMVSVFYYYSLVVCINSKKLYSKGKISFELFQLSVGCHISFFAALLYSFTGTPIDAYRSALWSSFLISLVVFISVCNKKATVNLISNNLISPKNPSKALN